MRRIVRDKKYTKYSLLILSSLFLIGALIMVYRQFSYSALPADKVGIVATPEVIEENGGCDEHPPPRGAERAVEDGRKEAQAFLDGPFKERIERLKAKLEQDIIAIISEGNFEYFCANFAYESQAAKEEFLRTHILNPLSSRIKQETNSILVWGLGETVNAAKVFFLKPEYFSWKADHYGPLEKASKSALRAETINIHLFTDGREILSDHSQFALRAPCGEIKVSFTIVISDKISYELEKPVFGIYVEDSYPCNQKGIANGKVSFYAERQSKSNRPIMVAASAQDPYHEGLRSRVVWTRVYETPQGFDRKIEKKDQAAWTFPD